MHSLKRTNAPLTHMTRISIIGLYHSLTERFENRFGKPRGDRRRERVGEEVGQIVCQRDVQHIGDVCGDLRVDVRGERLLYLVTRRVPGREREWRSDIDVVTRETNTSIRVCQGV